MSSPGFFGKAYVSDAVLIKDNFCACKGAVPIVVSAGFG